MASMRILVCASEAPLPPLNGVRLQVREVCARLAERHDVCVLAFEWPGQCGEPPAGVELRRIHPPSPGGIARARDRALSVVRREPVEAAGLAPSMTRMIEALRAEREFDVAHVTLGQLAGVAPALARLPAVLAPLDAWDVSVAVEAAGAQGAHYAWLRLQGRLVTRHIARRYGSFARIVLVSEADARETRRIDASLRTIVIPNGVDAAHYRPDPEVARSPEMLVFTGTLDYTANVTAARHLAVDVLPRVREQLPQAELALVGRTPSAAVRALARLPGVTVAADVADVRPFLAQAGVFACAMTAGTGIKNKLLEAMACGVPCVATPLACQGLSVRDDRELLVAAEGAEFAKALVRVMRDPALAARLGRDARAHVVAHHSWEAIVRRYEGVYAEAVASG
jgi:glycosyltransferase involved in cell wall biosynthesis